MDISWIGKLPSPRKSTVSPLATRKRWASAYASPLRSRKRTAAPSRTATAWSAPKTPWGKTAGWCDYSGILSNRLVGITVMPDPKNFRPSWFHSRDYGLIVANPFGQKAFAKTSEPSSIPVKKDESFTLHFAAFIHSSPTNEPPDLNAAFKTFTNQN
ncbi:MAG: PmoA family protein [Verrucomicrobiota bacterium]